MLTILTKVGGGAVSNSFQVGAQVALTAPPPFPRFRIPDKIKVK